MKRSWSEFEAYVYEVMKKENIPGTAVAVAERGRVIYEKGFGYRDVAQKLAVTPETIFGIASVTKSLTAAAILVLEQEGQLSVDDPVTKYIPELAIPSLEPMDEIRIHHLLSHTTGLPPVKRNESLNRLQEHVTYLNAIALERLGKPGEYLAIPMMRFSCSV
jgi:CubicO group peptidase (beta-lactamase class C family)